MRAGAEFGSVRHLTGRFFGALWPGGPSAAGDAWARQWLLPGEQQLWESMSGPDRRHAVGVARRTLALLGYGPASADTRGPGGTGPEGPWRAVAASALLHDVGKIEAGLGTITRSAATGLALVVGRRRLASSTPDEGTWRRRLRLYFTHDHIGAELLERAGSDPLTVTWAAQHHQRRESWTIELRIADALKAADGD